MKGLKPYKKILYLSKKAKLTEKEEKELSAIKLSTKINDDDINLAVKEMGYTKRSALSLAFLGVLKSDRSAVFMLILLLIIFVFTNNKLDE